MVFQPHLGRLAARHQPEYVPREPASVQRSISVFAAMAEAFRLFFAGPLEALGLGLAWAAASGIPLLVALIVTEAGHSYDESSAGSAVRLAGWRVPDEYFAGVVMVLLFFLIGSPLLVGVYGAAVRSARLGRPTCQGLLSGFTQYLWAVSVAPFALGAGALCALIPGVGLVLDLLIGTYTWIVASALADRQRGLGDALSVANAIVAGRWLPLVLLNLCAGIIACLGALPYGLALIVTIPVMVLMLGVGYREAAEAAGVAPAEVPA